MIRVTCAIILNEEDEVLIVRRGPDSDHPLKWEFPGGKLKEGETDEECIIREIREELSMDIVIRRKLDEVEYDYGIKQIVLVPFVCDTLDDLPVLSEHIEYRWLSGEKLREVDFSEADIIVAVNYLKDVPAEGSYDVEAPSSHSGTINDEELQSMVRNIRGTKEAEWLAATASENPVVAGRLLEYSLSDDRDLAFHASWALGKVCDRYPGVVYPHLPRIVDTLETLSDESTHRSFLRVLSLSDMKMISAKQQGLLADHCFIQLKSGFSSIAVRAYAMEILYKLACLYPELTNEVTATINMLADEKSAGIVAKGKIVLKKLGREIRGTGSSHR